jgi:hypothetical protein
MLADRLLTPGRRAYQLLIDADSANTDILNMYIFPLGLTGVLGNRPHDPFGFERAVFIGFWYERWGSNTTPQTTKSRGMKALQPPA